MSTDDYSEGAVQIGEVGSPHGIAGAVRVLPTTDFPERLPGIQRIWLDRVEGDGWPVVEWTWNGNVSILQLREVASREQAAMLRGRRIVVPRTSLPKLPDGTFYWYQLLGMAVRELDGRELGRVEHVQRRGGAHDFLEVSRSGHSPFWIPMVRAIVHRVDLTECTVWVSLPEGLEDLN